MVVKHYLLLRDLERVRPLDALLDQLCLYTVDLYKSSSFEGLTFEKVVHHVFNVDVVLCRGLSNEEEVVLGSKLQCFLQPDLSPVWRQCGEVTFIPDEGDDHVLVGVASDAVHPVPAVLEGLRTRHVVYENSTKGESVVPCRYRSILLRSG